MPQDPLIDLRQSPQVTSSSLSVYWAPGGALPHMEANLPLTERWTLGRLAILVDDLHADPFGDLLRLGNGFIHDGLDCPLRRLAFF